MIFWAPYHCIGFSRLLEEFSQGCYSFAGHFAVILEIRRFSEYQAQFLCCCSHRQPLRKARKLLVEHGILLPGRARHMPRFSCWKCQTTMTKQPDGSLRCPVSKTICSRPRVTDPTWAFTPFYNLQSFGDQEQVDFVAFIRSAYCIGLKVTNDAAIHLVKEAGIPTETMRTRLFKLYRLHKIALAYGEFHIAKALSFPANDVIEVDTARHGSRRDAGDRVHTGRQLLFKARRSKKWTTHVLGQSRSSGSRGSKPETKSEVTPLVQQKVPQGAILAADGAAAWVSAAKTGKTHLLKGVSHAKKIFTPVSRLLKKDISEKARRFLKKQSVPGGLCKDYKKHFVLAAGDQACESQFAHIQQTSARLQGKGKKMSDVTRSLNSQAASALLREPGFVKVLASHNLYRRHLLEGTLQLAPSDAYIVDKCAWLRGDL